MVKVREEHIFNADGSIKFDDWLRRLESFGELNSHEQIKSACDISWKAEQQAIAVDNIWSTGSSSYRTGLEMAEILAHLHLDPEAIIASILYRAVRESKLALDKLREEFGEGIAKLVEGVLRMAAISETDSSKERVLGQSGDQIENIRKMLLALVDDVRVALIKLAERTCAIRAVKDSDAQRRKKVALEVFHIYAPLAHRLGIGQLKWELEDLSFRYLEPDNYMKIAKLLDERRIDREKYITSVLEELRRQLHKASIDGELTGRAKHIHSIWRKMQAKNIGFSQVYDVRAVRVLVPEVKDCYATLGIVHNLWRVIPNEFDDYIATPKENGYQSLHTAVIGPDSKTFEIQIRTFAMDEDAELGVCAHWQYKEGSGDTSDKDSYTNKIAWLRQVLAWHDEMGVSGGLIDLLRYDSSIQNRVYVFTPEGHVVDLMHGATPLDFAYHVHTEVGNTCRGAKVNGKITPLNHELKTGDWVEVLISKGSTPNREWLKSSLGYVKTSRARARIVDWFKRQNREQNIEYGKKLLVQEFARLAVTELDYTQLAEDSDFKTEVEMFAAVGSGDVQLAHLINSSSHLPKLSVVDDTVAVPEEQLEDKTATPSNQKPALTDRVLRGMGSLLPHFASCCEPTAGDPVVGCVAANNSVIVHRVDCPEVLQYQNNHTENLLQLNWEIARRITYPVIINIEAYDRSGLLRDVSVVLATEEIEVTEVRTRTDPQSGRAIMKLHLRVENFSSLALVLDKISRLNNILEARRIDN